MKFTVKERNVLLNGGELVKSLVKTFTYNMCEQRMECLKI